MAGMAEDVPLAGLDVAVTTGTNSQQTTLVCLQVPHGDGYWTHPPLLDAATHFGAVADTNAVWQDGVPAAARVPVALGAYTVTLPTSALVWCTSCAST